MTRKIITNYTIDEDNAPPQPNHKRVLSQAHIQETEAVIPSHHGKEPAHIDVLKNAHGVITTIVVTCGCGEEITILLDYE
jgi:hypothetical protein